MLLPSGGPGSPVWLEGRHLGGESQPGRLYGATLTLLSLSPYFNSQPTLINSLPNLINSQPTFTLTLFYSHHDLTIILLSPYFHSHPTLTTPYFYSPIFNSHSTFNLTLLSMSLLSKCPCPCMVRLSPFIIHDICHGRRDIMQNKSKKIKPW